MFVLIVADQRHTVCKGDVTASEGAGTGDSWPAGGSSALCDRRRRTRRWPRLPQCMMVAVPLVPAAVCPGVWLPVAPVFL